MDDLMFVTVDDDGSIEVSASSAAELKIAIKELRLVKKDLAAQKKEVTADIAAVRAEQRTRVAHHKPMVRGGGMFGKILRTTTQISRANARASTDNAVRPLEAQKNNLDMRMLVVDRTIAQVEAAILRSS